VPNRRPIIRLDASHSPQSKFNLPALIYPVCVVRPVCPVFAVLTVTKFLQTQGLVIVIFAWSIYFIQTFLIELIYTDLSFIQSRNLSKHSPHSHIPGNSISSTPALRNLHRGRQVHPPDKTLLIDLNRVHQPICVAISLWVRSNVLVTLRSEGSTRARGPDSINPVPTERGIDNLTTTLEPVS
jgi:hypothetical protein